jgi:hypothetical protein
MQTLSSRSPNSLSQQSRKIALFAILLFALSGLISGFAVGAFVRPKFGIGTTSPGSRTTPVGQNTETPVITKTSNPVKLGYPVFMPLPASNQIADGATLYTVNIQAVDRAIDAGHGYPVHAPDITCKLWLIQRVQGDIKVSIPHDRLKDLNTLADPITSDGSKGAIIPGLFPEIQGLNFDPTTQQTRYCDSDGRGTWKYTISSSVAPGDYDLLTLVDWQGQYYNWSWAHIEIKNAG